MHLNRLRRHALVTGVLVSSAVIAVGASGAGAAKKGKKKKAPSTANVTKQVNAPIPQDAAAGQSVPVTSTIDIGKAFKGKVVGDVDVTGITTTGSAAGAADDLVFKVTAPSGRTVRVINQFGDQNIGPWTLNDDTKISACDANAPTCPDPDTDLVQPFAGTSNLLGLGGGGTGPLSVLDGLPMKGTWTLTVFDRAGNATTSTLVSWGLRVTAAKPPKGAAPAKKGKKKSGVFRQTSSASKPLPDATNNDVATPVTTTFTVPKSFKGKVVGDVNITGIKTSGAQANSADDLAAWLIAPSGRMVYLWDSNLSGQSIGPLTIDDDTPVSTCDQPAPTCPDPDADLVRPFAGTANMLGTGSGDTGPLARLRGVTMAGNWQFVIVDRGPNGATSTLNGVGLEITPAKPVQASKSKAKKSAGAAAAKGKKKKRKPKSSVAVSRQVGQVVPEDPGAGQSTPLISTIRVNDKGLKGQTVGDVNLTGLSLAGSTNGALQNLGLKLTSPNGTTVMVDHGFSGTSVGPLTLDDDSAQSICFSPTPVCQAPFTFVEPYAGTANALFLGAMGTGGLAGLNGAPVNGTWTLTAFDDDDDGQTITLNAYGLKITAAKPVQ